MLDLARHIVNQKSERFEPDKFEDQYDTALIDLINQKRAGKPITPKERSRGENVVDLMEALRRSVGGAAAATQSAKKPARKTKKAASGCQQPDEGTILPGHQRVNARQVSHPRQSFSSTKHRSIGPVTRKPRRAALPD